MIISKALLQRNVIALAALAVGLTSPPRRLNTRGPDHLANRGCGGVQWLRMIVRTVLWYGLYTAIVVSAGPTSPGPFLVLALPRRGLFAERYDGKVVGRTEAGGSMRLNDGMEVRRFPTGETVHRSREMLNNPSRTMWFGTEVET